MFLLRHFISYLAWHRLCRDESHFQDINTPRGEPFWKIYRRLDGTHRWGHLRICDKVCFLTFQAPLFVGQVCRHIFFCFYKFRSSEEELGQYFKVSMGAISRDEVGIAHFYSFLRVRGLNRRLFWWLFLGWCLAFGWWPGYKARSNLSKRNVQHWTPLWKILIRDSGGYGLSLNLLLFIIVIDDPLISVPTHFEAWKVGFIDDKSAGQNHDVCNDKVRTFDFSSLMVKILFAIILWNSLK